MSLIAYWPSASVTALAAPSNDPGESPWAQTRAPATGLPASSVTRPSRVAAGAPAPRFAGRAGPPPLQGGGRAQPELQRVAQQPGEQRLDERPAARLGDHHGHPPVVRGGRGAGEPEPPVGPGLPFGHLLVLP